MENKHKCECPEIGKVRPGMESWYSEEEKIGMNHPRHKCKCVNDLKLYLREDKKLWLCSCCCLRGDVEQ